MSDENKNIQIKQKFQNAMKTSWRKKTYFYNKKDYR